MVFLAALASAVHVLAFGLGLPAIWLRARALARGDVGATLLADNVWGIAAVLWLSSGLARAFGGLEKGSAWYLHSPLFLGKMGVFGAVLLLELWPMVTLIRWRVQKRSEPEKMPAMAKISYAEVGLTLLLPFLAAAMARGL